MGPKTGRIENRIRRLIAAARCNTWGEVEEMRATYGVLPHCVGVDARHESKEVREIIKSIKHNHYKTNLKKVPKA